MTRTEPIRVLRVIARLNVGGPALHVCASEQRARQARLRDDARRRPGRGGRGLDGVLRGRARCQAALSSTSPAGDLRSHRTGSRGPTARAAHQKASTRRPAHPYREGRSGRADGRALLAGSARPPVVVHTFHGHVLRRLLQPRPGARVPADRADACPLHRRPRLPSARRSATTASRLNVAAAGNIAVIRLGLDLERRTGRSPLGLARRFAPRLGGGRRQVVAFVGLARAHDRDQARGGSPVGLRV